MQGLCLLPRQVPPSPKPSLGQEAGWRGVGGGGWELRARLWKPCTHVSLPDSARASPRPREKRWLSSPGPAPTAQTWHPGRKGLRPHLPCWPGEGAAQVSWLSGFGHVRHSSVMVPQAREVPAHAKTTASPPRASRGPSKKECGPPAHLIEDPGTIHPDPPAPPQRN